MCQNKKDRDFFGDGLFKWQFETPEHENAWRERTFNKDKYWGGFSADAGDPSAGLPPWAIGPFEKYKANPVFKPDKDSWDCGRFGGGVHNGSVIKRDGLIYYIYRGEMPAERVVYKGFDELVCEFDYKCDIGIAVSDDGISFRRDTEHSPIFRRGENERFSFEDANCVFYGGTYYLFCNRWNWSDPKNTEENGVYLALSKDLKNWESVGMVFPGARRLHRNACVVQTSDNEAVKINGRFIMYLNDGLIAESEDLIHWKSREVRCRWPGGEGCFALYRGGEIILFTGGHHTGHFYAIGEVLFNANVPDVPVDYLKTPVLCADASIPYEDGFSCEKPHFPVSNWRNTVFFTGLTEKDGCYYVYYGGSEYYTCLATCKITNKGEEK